MRCYVKKITFKILLVVGGLAAVVIFDFAHSEPSLTPQKRDFWHMQKKGANIFNRVVRLKDIKSARKYGINFIRLAPDKFISKQRDFLIGDADDYTGLVKEDLEHLKMVLDMCSQEGMPVVITMLSLPGSRWKQLNNNKDDLRLWGSKKFQKQAAQFWRDLASELKGYPGIVGYNILNEPHLERIYSPEGVDISAVLQEKIQTILFNVCERVIQAIRSVDPHTPIIVDSSAYADAKTFKHFKPQGDQNVLYSFHMYEPYEYTNFKRNRGRFRYPGKILRNNWNKKELKNYMKEVLNFQKRHGIASHKILVGEFGGHRTSAGLDEYFQDLIDIFNEEKWHFAFYAFREDTWDGMDYELGDKKLPWSYWKALENNETPHLDRKNTHLSFLVIQKALNSKKDS